MWNHVVGPRCGSCEYYPTWTIGRDVMIVCTCQSVNVHGFSWSRSGTFNEHTIACEEYMEVYSEQGREAT